MKYLPCLFAMAIPLMLSGCNGSGEAKAELGALKSTADVVMKEDVATTTAEQVTIPEVIRLTGSLAPDEQSDVAGKRGGIVINVLVDRGSVVAKGDVLVQLDTTDAVNALDQVQAQAAELLVRLGLKSADEQFDPSKQPDVQAAQAALDLASRNFDRSKSLRKSNVISSEEHDEARNIYNTARQQYDLAVAQANQLYRQFQTALIEVRSARQVLEDMTIEAPYDGAVVERFVAPGEAINDHTRVVSMVRINPIRLVLSVPEQAVGKIEKGREVKFNVDAFPGRLFHGTIKRISPMLDETRTLVVEAEVPNRDRLLKPGLFATAQVELEEKREGITVPESAVRREDNLARVFVVDEGVARAKMVVAGETRRGNVEIVEGLQGGEQIVNDASQVEDGVRIQ